MAIYLNLLDPLSLCVLSKALIIPSWMLLVLGGSVRRWWQGLGRAEQIALLGILVGILGALPAYLAFLQNGSDSPAGPVPTTVSLPPSTSSGSGTLSSTTAGEASTTENIGSDCSTPRISVQPGEGKIGTRITVRGCSFPPNTVLTSGVGQVFVHPDLPPVRTDGQGRFRVVARLNPSGYNDYNKPLTIGYEVESNDDIYATEYFLVRE
jgi:hypothetical protein